MKPTSQHESLHVAFSAILSGQDDAFAAIESYYQPVLFDYLMRHTGQINRSRDTTEEAFHSIRPFVIQMSSLDELVCQLFKTARNFCADVWDSDTSKLEPPPYDPNKLQQFFDIENALRHMATSQRECLLLRYRYKLSDDQILKITSFSPEQLKSTFDLALISLGEELIARLSDLSLFPLPHVSDDKTKDLSLIIKGLKKSGSQRLFKKRFVFLVFILLLAGFTALVWAFGERIRF